MRQITKDATMALLNGEDFKRDNTVVKNRALYLFGNKIAWLDINDRLFISNAGFFTATTKERLNGLPYVSINQKKGTWYLNGEQWNGYPKCVTPW